jgi:hypothetical protein
MPVIDAVAAGGVLRALNKENGPIRKSKSSYGLGRYETYDRDVHQGQETVPGFHNGKTYVSTIHWVSKLVRFASSTRVTTPISDEINRTRSCRQHSR